MTSGYEGHINVAIFQGVSCFGEGQVLNLNVFISNAISFQDLTGVSFSAAAGSANGYTFAFAISNRLNTGILQSHNLNGFRIQGADTFQVADFLVFEHFTAVSSIVSNIVLNKCQIYLALFQQVNVGHGSTRGLCGGIGAFHILVQNISQSTAQWEVGTSSTTGSNVNKFLVTSSRCCSFLVTTTATTCKHRAKN